MRRNNCRPPGLRDAGRTREPRRVIVEERIDFDFEITLLTVRSRAEDGQTCTDFCAPIGHIQVKGDYVESLAAAGDVAGGIGTFASNRRSGHGAFGRRGIFGVNCS